jgi:hypothetical protein
LAIACHGFHCPIPLQNLKSTPLDEFGEMTREWRQGNEGKNRQLDLICFVDFRSLFWQAAWNHSTHACRSAIGVPIAVVPGLCPGFLSLAKRATEC